MNRSRMLALAQMIENIPGDKFEMQYYFSKSDEDGDFHPLDVSNFIDDPYSCGTAACIAGWTQVLIDMEASINQSDESLILLKYHPDIYHYSSDARKIAQEYLGIDSDLAAALFYANRGSIWHRMAEELDLEYEYFDSPLVYEVNWSSIQPHHAAKVLRMIANNQIPWIKNGVIQYG